MRGIPQLSLSVSVLGSTSDQGFPSLLHGWPHSPLGSMSSTAVECLCGTGG